MKIFKKFLIPEFLNVVGIIFSFLTNQGIGKL